MPRKPWKTRAVKPALTEGMRYFLTTGDYRLRARFPDCPDRGLIFRLAHPSPAARARLRRVWLTFREDILAGWTRPGLPWGAQEFDGPGASRRRT